MLLSLAESIGITVEKSWGWDVLLRDLDEVAEAHLIQPTFITEYPAEVSRWRAVMMLTRKSPTVLNSSSVVEIGNGFEGIKRRKIRLNVSRTG